MFRSALACLSVLSLASAYSFAPTANSRLKFSRHELYSSKVTVSRSKSAITMAAAGPRRVVVTGMGITSCLGNTLDDVANSLKEARYHEIV